MCLYVYTQICDLLNFSPLSLSYFNLLLFVSLVFYNNNIVYYYYYYIIIFACSFSLSLSLSLSLSVIHSLIACIMYSFYYYIILYILMRFGGFCVCVTGEKIYDLSTYCSLSLSLSFTITK